MVNHRESRFLSCPDPQGKKRVREWGIPVMEIRVIIQEKIAGKKSPSGIIDLFERLVGKLLHAGRYPARGRVIHFLHGIGDLGPEDEDRVFVLHLALVLLGGRDLQGIVPGKI